MHVLIAMNQARRVVDMNNIELRWVAERISSSHKSMTLQYRVYKDHGGPYPNYAWTEWMPVPTVDIEKISVKD